MRAVLCVLSVAVLQAVNAGVVVLDRIERWNRPTATVAGAKPTLTCADGVLTLTAGGPDERKARCVLASRPFPFKANARYRLSCEMRTETPGIVQLGVGHWPKGYDKFFFRTVPFLATKDWMRQSFEVRTPGTNEIPALAAGKTAGYVKLPYGKGADAAGPGASMVQFRNWTLEELPIPPLPPETKPPFGNCVPNASFELGLAPHGVQSYTDYGPNAQPPVWTTDETAAVHGRRSLRIDNTRTGFRTRFASCELYPGPGTNWVVSVWIKADRAAKVTLGIMDTVYDRDFQTEQWLVNRRTCAVGTDWTRCVLARPRGGWRRLSVHVTVDEPCVCWLDGLQVECGEAMKPSVFHPAAAAETAWSLPKHLYLRGEKAEATKTSMTYADPTSLKEEKVSVPTDRYGVFTVGDGLGAKYAVVGEVPSADPSFYTGFNGFEGLFTQPDGRLTWRDDGTHSVDEHFRQLKLAGANMVRLHDSGTWWYTVEKTKGVYDWTTLDLSVDKCLANGIVPLFVFGNGGVVAERGKGSFEDRLKTWFVRQRGTYCPSGLGARRCVRIDPDDWDSWVTAVVTRYRGRIRHYEIYNEPNLTCPSAEEYAACLKRSHALIRRLDSEAVVIGICATGDYGADTGSFVEKVGELGGFDSLDWMSFHPYNAMLDFTVRKAEDQLVDIRRLADRYRPGVPLLNDELYYMADRRFVTHDTGLSRDWPAGNLIRRYVMDKAAGLCGSISITALQLYDGDAGHPSAMQVAWLANGWQPNERFVAANAFARFLNGATFFGKPRERKGLNAFAFRDRNGQAVTVQWAVTPNDAAEIGIPDGTTAFDLFGNQLKDRSLLLGESPVYFVER